MYLLHSGKLKSYADQNNPCEISVRSASMEAHFQAWYSKQTLNTNIEGNIIVVECCFIKKASILFYISGYHSSFL